MAQCSMRPKFAERDRLWEAGDPAYLALSDALQYLGPSHLRSRGKLVLEQNEFLAPSLANGVRHRTRGQRPRRLLPPVPNCSGRAGFRSTANAGLSTATAVVEWARSGFPNRGHKICNSV
jgi:hypothetical protein